MPGCQQACWGEQWGCVAQSAPEALPRHLAWLLDAGQPALLPISQRPGSQSTSCCGSTRRALDGPPLLTGAAWASSRGHGAGGLGVWLGLASWFIEVLSTVSLGEGVRALSGLFLKGTNPTDKAFTFMN